ncbi:MAG: low molecular weight phosphatase family protein [Candidatus Aminicenantes bacterium]|nr:low molecular weight phosphatase family protein [Candidatus Aminicenantes bacterium]
MNKQSDKKTREKEVTRLLFVCYGNICRSPMAEGLANHIPGGAVKAESAGIGAVPGPATKEAVAALKKKYNIDISAHRARHVRDVNLDLFDYLIAMDSMVYSRLREAGLVPESKLFEWNIEDPIGTPVWVFEKIAEKIQDRLDNFLINREVC